MCEYFVRSSHVGWQVAVGIFEQETRQKAGSRKQEEWRHRRLGVRGQAGTDDTVQVVHPRRLSVASYQQPWFCWHCGIDVYYCTVICVSLNTFCTTSDHVSLHCSLYTTCLFTKQGRSDGGYIGIYTPKSVYLNFVCGCFVSLQGLVNIYTHPNQIPGYASVTK